MSEESDLPFLEDEVQETEAEEVIEAKAEPPEKEEPGEKPEAEPEEVKAEKPDSTPEPEAERHIPLTALLDEREKRQESARRAEAAEAEVKRMRQQIEAARMQQQEKPDFFDNPERALQASMTGMKLQQSRFFAEREYGEDVVKEAYAYFDQHPEESQQLLNHPSPFHAAVEFYKRQKVMQDMGQDPDAYINSLVEQKLQERLAEAQPTKPQTPPPSMAKAPSRSQREPASGDTFDEMFPR